MENTKLHKAAELHSSEEYKRLKGIIYRLASTEMTTLSIDPSSAMCRRDKRCADQYSQYLQSLYRISLDCLDSAIRLYDNEDKPIAAHAVLIRTAIECSSIGIWLLSAGKDQKAVFQTLKLLYNEAYNAAAVYKQFPDDDVSGMTKKLQKAYSDFHQDLDLYKDHDLTNPVKKYQLVENADREYVKREKRKRYDGLWAWKAGSAITHGNTGMVSAISETFHLNERAEEGNKVGYMQPNMSMTVLLLLPAVENMEQFFNRFVEQSSPTKRKTRRGINA